MALPRETTITPLAIRDIEIVLFDDAVDQKAKYGVQIEYSNGDIIERRGFLLPHLSTADKTWLSDFMDRMRAKAEAEMLPE